MNTNKKAVEQYNIQLRICRGLLKSIKSELNITVYDLNVTNNPLHYGHVGRISQLRSELEKAYMVIK